MKTEKQYLTAKEIIAKVARTQIENKFGSVANAITEMCERNKNKMREHDITLVHGDLAFCKVCKAGEGELTTECCGRRMSEEERNRVYKIGDLDFINGKWTKK